MKLEVGKTYKAKDGTRTRIGGPTQYADFVWGVNGHWYEASTGFWINSSPAKPGSLDIIYRAVANDRALVEEVPPPEERPVDRRPERHGWAPGAYLTKCLHCDWTFLGGKRAYVCAPCAYGDEKVP